MILGLRFLVYYFESLSNIKEGLLNSIGFLEGVFEHYMHLNNKVIFKNLLSDSNEKKNLILPVIDQNLPDERTNLNKIILFVNESLHLRVRMCLAFTDFSRTHSNMAPLIRRVLIV